MPITAEEAFSLLGEGPGSGRSLPALSTALYGPACVVTVVTVVTDLQVITRHVTSRHERYITIVTEGTLEDLLPSQARAGAWPGRKTPPRARG